MKTNTRKLVETRKRLQQEIPRLSNEQLSDRLNRVSWGVYCETWGHDYEGLDAARSELHLLQEEWQKRHPRRNPSKEEFEIAHAHGKLRSPLARLLEEE
jgi:hypothetical protein